MPFFHDQDRSGLRRHYLEAWRKHCAGMPLEPLEYQLVTVIEQHPEYHALFEDEALALARDYHAGVRAVESVPAPRAAPCDPRAGRDRPAAGHRRRASRTGAAPR